MGADLAAVLWDMDGTLVDTEGLWSITMGELAEHLGGGLSAEVREELTGSSLVRTVTTIRRHVGLDPDDAAGVEADGRWLLDRTLALFARGVPWRPGARDALRAVREAGLATALVTSTYREVVEVSLDTVGREHFDVVVCGDEVSATKPDPAPTAAPPSCSASTRPPASRSRTRRRAPGRRWPRARRCSSCPQTWPSSRGSGGCSATRSWASPWRSYAPCSTT